MVGVPALSRWVGGPSCRMTWPICSSRSLRMVNGPQTSDTTNAVRLAAAVRNVMYWTHVQQAELGVQRIQKVKEHQPHSAFSRSTTRSTRTPREPFTSTRSPARTRSAASVAAAALAAHVST